MLALTVGVVGAVCLALLVYRFHREIVELRREVRKQDLERTQLISDLRAVQDEAGTWARLAAHRGELVRSHEASLELVLGELEVKS